MTSKIKLKLINVQYGGDSIGNDISLDVSLLGQSFRFAKRIKRGQNLEVNQALGNLELPENIEEINVTVKVTEKDFIFSDSGQITQTVKINNNETLPQRFEFAITVTERRKIFWKSKALFKVIVEVLLENTALEQKLRPYQSANSKHYYNRFDKQIIAAADRWNKEFVQQSNPPPTPLDPNLLKAMIFVESFMGYGSYVDYPSYPDVMQVGNPKDKAIHVFHDDGKESTEYEVIGGELKKFCIPEANGDTDEASIIWGARWLYHKAQINIQEGSQWKREWRTWFEAVKRYNSRESYLINVKQIYEQGVDPRSGSKLWIIIGFLIVASGLTFLFLHPRHSADAGQNTFFSQSSDVWNASREQSVTRILDSSGLVDEPAITIKKQILGSYSTEDLRELEGLEISLYSSSTFLAIVEWEKDWWEELKVGKFENGNIAWFNINNPPTEASIVSARFIKVVGIFSPVLEVFATTHMGNGYMYLYKMKENKLYLFFDTYAVDSHNEDTWRPEGYPKYGYNSCGEVYEGGRLMPTYRDINGDGVSDVILKGKSKVICEHVESYKPFESRDVTVDIIPVKFTYYLTKSKI